MNVTAAQPVAIQRARRRRRGNTQVQDAHQRGMAGASAPPIRGSVARPERTAVPWATLDEAGLRFVRAITPGLPHSPARVFSGLKNGATPAERVDAAIAEMERTGAFTKGKIAIVVTTGGGHVNPAVVESLERMTDGDCATVAMQYGTLPSAASFMKIDAAVEHYELLLRRIRDRLGQLYPGGGGPEVVLYGESLGAWTGRELLRRNGSDALDRLGIDRVVWVGVPGLSRDDATSAPEVEAATLPDLRAATGPSTRIVSYTHHDDPVGVFRPSLLWSRPRSPQPLVDARSGERIVPKAKRGMWLPLVSFIQVGVDLIKSTREERVGPFEERGHDYRGAIPELVRTGFGLDVSDAVLARTQQAVAQSNAWVLDTDWSLDNRSLDPGGASSG